MSRPVKYLYNVNPFYLLLKKHYCPRCKERLKKTYYSKVVNSSSEDAKNFNFQVGDTFYSGDVEFKTKLFYCPTCNLEISCNDMKKIERNKRITK